MKFNFFHYFSIAACGLGLSAAAFATTFFVVSEGDKLSKIAGKKIQGPVYGKNGSLKPVLALNPKIKNPDLIFPGQKIQLPGEEVAQASPKIAGNTIILKDNLAEPLPRTERSGGLEISAGPEFVQINNKDRSTAAVASISGEDFHFQLGWQQPIGSSFTGYVRGGGAFYALAQSTSVAQFSALTPITWDFSLGIQKQLSPDFTLALDTYYRELLAASPQSATMLSVDTVRVPEAGLSARYVIQRFPSSLFGVGGSVNALLPGTTGSYSSQLGSLEEGYLYYENTSASQWSWNAQLGGAFSSFTTPASSVNQESVSLQLGLKWGGRKSTPGNNSLNETNQNK